jgi:hypothetical protein
MQHTKEFKLLSKLTMGEKYGLSWTKIYQA